MRELRKAPNSLACSCLANNAGATWATPDHWDYMGSTFGSVLRESSPKADTQIIALRYNAQNVLLPHRHDDPYISVLVHGKYTELCAMRPRRCEVPAVIAHSSGEEHADYFLTDAVCINIYGADCPAERGRAVAAALAARPPSDWRQAFEVIESVMGRALNDAAPSKPIPPPWLQRVLCEFNWIGNAPLLAAAEYGGVHPAHLVRAFRTYLGTTPSAFRHRARIIEASFQLLTTSASLSQIAAETGFYDQSDFTHRFSDASGLPPGRFRSIFGVKSLQDCPPTFDIH